MVSGVDFRCVTHHFSSLTRLKGSWGQVRPENGPKPKHKLRFEFPNILGIPLTDPCDGRSEQTHVKAHRSILSEVLTWDYLVCASSLALRRSPTLNAKFIAIKPRNKHYNLSFGLFRSFSGRAWPRDPFQRVKLDKWCRTHLELAPETNAKAMSWPFPGLSQESLNYK